MQRTIDDHINELEEMERHLKESLEYSRARIKTIEKTMETLQKAICSLKREKCSGLLAQEPEQKK